MATTHSARTPLYGGTPSPEAFIGGSGLDMIIFGATDRDAVADPSTGVRLLSPPFGVPGFPQGVTTADLSGLGSFCTVEASPSPGYDYLVRFHSAATGNIIVTVRVTDVEQVFCTSQSGAGAGKGNAPTFRVTP